MADRDLEESYTATTYMVEIPGSPLRLRIGHANAALDELLRRHSATEWAFITAWNPESVRTDDDVNERKNAELLERIAQMGYVALSGAGVGDMEGWAERSFFIIGIPQADALELGRSYRQHAIVAGHYGAPPELLWC